MPSAVQRAFSTQSGHFTRPFYIRCGTCGFALWWTCLPHSSAIGCFWCWTQRHGQRMQCQCHGRIFWGICFPLFLFREGHQESMRRVCDSDLGGSQLAISTRVPRPSPYDTHSSLPSSAMAGPASPAEDQGASQQSQPAPASRLVTVRESLLSSGTSDRVFQLVSQPRHNSTENIYNYR